MYVVETHDVLKTGRREIINLDACGFLQGLVLLEAGLLDHVDFTGDDGIELGLRVTDDDPFHPVKVHRSAACQAAGRFAAWHILGVALIDRHRAGFEFVRFENERARANVFLDLLGAGCGCNARRHDERHIRRRFAQSLQHDRARLFEHHAKRIRVRRFQLVDKPEQHAAHGVARGPSLERGRHIFTGHRFAIVKSQTAAQFKRPDFAVLAGAVALHHLRLDFSFGILGK